MHGEVVMDDLTEPEEVFAEPEHTDATPDNAISPGQLYDILTVPEESRSIRLLDLDAPSDPNEDASSNSGPLSAHLRVARLQDSPSFASLSYVWGESSTTPSHEILCHPYGCRMEITANCYAALCQIRKRFGAVTIWVDSVCINQADDAEKARQIPLMQEIYSWAEETYVWLGPGDDESYQAMDWIRDRAALMTPIPLAVLAAASERKRGEERACFRRKLWRDAIWRMKHCNRVLLWSLWDNPKKPAPTSIDGLLGRCWAQRMWTFQEIALSAAPIILCGNRCISWGDIVSGVYDFKRLEKDLGYASETLDCWKSIIDLWLCMPREASWNGNALREHFGSASSFEDLIKDLLEHHAYLVHGLRRFMEVLAYSQFMLALTTVTLGLAFTSIWMLESRVALKLVLMLGLPAALFFGGLGALLFDPAILVGYPHTELLRHSQERLSDRERQALVAIRVALLERFSSIPHDRSFALSGVLSSFGVAVPTPDYTKQLGETYLCLLNSLIAWKPTAIALLIDGGSTRLPDTPTWVPQWGTPRPAPWLVSRYQMGSSMSLMSSVTDGEIEPLIGSFRITGSRLSISGAKRGAVSFRTELGVTGGTPEVASSSCPPPSVADAVTWLNRIRKGRQQSSAVRDSCKDDLTAAFCVLRGLTPARKDPDSMATTWLRGFSYDFSDQQKNFERFRIVYMRCLRADQTAQGVWDGMRESARYRKYFLDMLEAVASDRRCLLVLDNGLAGSGPLDVRCGDEVFLLRGVPAPMVLRPTGERTYSVVGAALVHGLMQGEGLSRASFSEVVELV